MENLLNSHSALHNFKQAHGLNAATSSNVSGYLLERRLLRILAEHITPKTARHIARSACLSIAELEDIVEGKVYDLGEQALSSAIEAYETGGILACLAFLNQL